MFGLIIFYNVFVNLSEEYKNKILGNIFSINNVSVSSVVIGEDSINFKLFSNGIFYQYIFLLKSGENNIIKDERIVYYKIFVFNNNIENNDNFICQLIQCSCEYQIYQLMKKVL